MNTTKKIDREKVLQALEHCDLCSDMPNCPGCDYLREPDCTEHLKRDIIALLKAQEPHLLTMEEVNNLPSCHVVIELNEMYGGFLHWIDGLLFCRNIDGSTDFITLCGKTRLPREEYGKKWRCWDKYVSGAQGEATPWRS